MKKIIILILSFLFIFTANAWKEEIEECIDDTDINIDSSRVLKSLSDEDRLTFVYCLVNEYTWKNVDNEEELIESGKKKAVDVASREELKLLEWQKALLKKDGKELWRDKRQKLAELKAWMDCWGKIKKWTETNIVACISDSRKNAFEDYENSGWFGWGWRMMSSLATRFKNWSLFSFWEVARSASFGYVKFDSFPEFPSLGEKGLFWNDSLYGLVNSMSLIAMIFAILFVFLRMWVNRDSDWLFAFLVKLSFAVWLVVFFPYLYSKLPYVLSLMEDLLINWVSSVPWVDQNMIEAWIKLNIMEEWVFTSTTAFSWFVWLINLFILLIVGLIIVVRNLFILVVITLFPLTAVWFILWIFKENNIFDSNDVSSKFSRYSSFAIFWVISMLLSVAVSIFAFKLVSIAMATIPSLFWDEWESMLEAVSRFSWDALLYFIILIVILAFTFKKLHKYLFNVVSNFFIGILFPQARASLNSWDFYDRVWESYMNIKTDAKEKLRWNEELRNAINNSPVIKDIGAKKIQLEQKLWREIRMPQVVSKNTKAIRSGVSLVWNMAMWSVGLSSWVTHQERLAGALSRKEKAVKELESIKWSSVHEVRKAYKLQKRVEAIDNEIKEDNQRYFDIRDWLMESVPEKAPSALKDFIDKKKAENNILKKSVMQWWENDLIKEREKMVSDINDDWAWIARAEVLKKELSKKTQTKKDEVQEELKKSEWAKEVIEWTEGMEATKEYLNREIDNNRKALGILSGSDSRSVRGADNSSHWSVPAPWVVSNGSSVKSRKSSKKPSNEVLEKRVEVSKPTKEDEKKFKDWYYSKAGDYDYSDIEDNPIYKKVYNKLVEEAWSEDLIDLLELDTKLTEAWTKISS